VERADESHLPHGRERGLGVVKKVEALAAEAIAEEGEEGFAVGLLVEGLAAAGINDAPAAAFGIESLDLCGDIEETRHGPAFPVSS
jgi:hypothetical protein